MLKKLTSSATAVYVTAAMAVIFICSLVFSPSLLSSGQRSVVGYAGSEPVTVQDVAAMRRALNQMLPVEAINPNDAEQQAFFNNQINSMIQQHAAMRAMMKRYGYVVPKAMIEADIRRQPAFQENGHYSAKKFKAFLDAQQMDIETFMRHQAVNYFQKTLLTVMAKLNEPSKTEKSLFEVIAATKRAIKSKSLDINEVQVNPPSEQTIAAYFKDHQLDYVLPVQTQYQYAILDRQLFKYKENPSHEALVEFFKQHMDRYIEPEQVLVQKAILIPSAKGQLTASQIKFLQTFIQQNAALDQMVENMAAESGKGYSLVMDKPIWKTVSELPAQWSIPSFVTKKVPIISANGGGFELIINQSHKQALTPTLDMVIAKVTDDYKQTMAESAYQTQLDQVLDLSHSKTMTWDDIKKMIPQVVIHKTPLAGYEQHAQAKPFTEYPALQAWLKDAYQDAQGHLNIKHLDQAMVIIEKTQEQPKRPQSYAEVKHEIKAMLWDQARIKKGEQTTEQWVKAAQSKQGKDGYFKTWKTNDHVRYATETPAMPYIVWAAALTLSQQNTATAVAILQSQKVKQWQVIKFLGDQKTKPDQAWYERVTQDWQKYGVISAMNQITQKYPMKFV